ncbi:MAG: hypothetical protein ABIP17_05460 [Ilumatobacteraceae bacterium]
MGADRDTPKCARSLARVWSRELVRSAAFAYGFVFLMMNYVLFALLWGGETDSWNETLQIAPWFAHPLVGMTIVGVHRAVTRARRDDVNELIGVCPLPEGVRTVGHLGAVGVPLAMFAVFVVAFVGTKELRGVGPIGTIGTGWLDLVSSMLLIVGGVALGVAIGRWVPFQVAPVLAVLAVLAVTLRLSTLGDPGWNPLAELSTVPPVEEIGELLAPRPNGWHVVWLLGLTGLTMIVAFAWSRRDRMIGALAVIALVVTGAGGIGATRGMSSTDADHIVDLIVAPETHQTCQTSSSGMLDVCVYDGFDEIVPVLMSGSQVADVVPGAGRFVIRQGLLETYVDEVPPEVRDRLPASRNRPANEIVVGLDPPSDASPARFALAFSAAGLPTEEPADGVPLIVVGQARSVVALWLATAGLSDDDAYDLLSTDSEHSNEPMARSAVWAGAACWVPPAVTSIEELDLARRLAIGDDARVAAVLTERWEHWIDPTTSTVELVAALELDGPIAFSPIEPHPYDTGC